MLTSRFKNIKKILKDFTGKNGEPKNNKEFYVLKSMWVMMCAEFEGSLKDSVENYIDCIKTKNDIKDMLVCFLLQNFHGNKDEKNEFSIKEIMGLFKNKKSDINYLNFTKNKKATYKSYAVEHLFNSLGIFLKGEEIINLKIL